MQNSNPFGFKDHRPFSGFSDELVYGVAEDGRHVHISVAERGLKCRCRCPACERELVAKKGKVQLHHFAHRNNAVTCAHAAETNAHIWAKEVLEREKRLTIPAISAEHAGQIEEVSPARTYEFVEARLEKRLDTIVPDVVLITENGTQLIVEVRVTHACEEVKLEKLQRDRLSAIEIDLRRFRTSSDRQAVEGALLADAPRVWLCNAKQGQFDERLRARILAEQQRKAREAEERARRAALAKEQEVRRAAQQVEHGADRLLRAARNHMGSIRELPDFAEKMMESFIGIPWSDMRVIGFTVRDPVWQAELVAKYLTYPNALDYQGFEYITTKDAMRAIEHYVIPAYMFEISGAVRERLHDLGEHRRMPVEAVEAFLDSLVSEGYFTPGPGSYSVSEEYAEGLAERERRRQAYERRLNDVRTRIGVVIARLPDAEQSGFELDTWMNRRLKQARISPDTLCRRGDDGYRELERALKHVELMSEGGPPVDELLGLPIAAEVERARARERDRLLKASSTRRTSLTQAARLQLGAAAEAWLSAPSDEDEELSRIDQAGLDDPSYQRERNALEKAGAARQAVLRAEMEALDRLAELREAAVKVFDKDHLDLFLRASHPMIGNSPLKHCVDARTLRECLALLPSGRTIRRKR